MLFWLHFLFSSVRDVSMFLCPQKSNFRTKNLIAIRDFYLTNSSAPLEFDYSVVHEMCLRYFGHAAATDKSGRPQRACGIPPLCLSGSSSIGAAPDWTLSQLLTFEVDFINKKVTFDPRIWLLSGTFICRILRHLWSLTIQLYMKCV